MTKAKPQVVTILRSETACRARLLRRVPSGRVAATALLAALLVTAACGAGGIRPRFQPLPQAMTDTVHNRPDSVTLLISELLTAKGIEVRHVRPREGYVETKWFETGTGRTVSDQSIDTDSVVRMRFWAEPAAEGETMVVGEVVRRRIIDPSLPDRETEEPVPTGHPALEIVRGVLANVKEHSES